MTIVISLEAPEPEFTANLSIIWVIGFIMF